MTAAHVRFMRTIAAYAEANGRTFVWWRRQNRAWRWRQA